MYKNILDKHGDKDFWDFCPKYFKETKEDSKSTDNYIYKFLEDVFDINGVKTYILKNNNYMEKLEDVRKIYEEYMRINHKNIKYKFNKENVAWTDLGFEIKELHICKNCLNVSKKDCCDKYSSTNRTRRFYVLHLKIVQD